MESGNLNNAPFGEAQRYAAMIPDDLPADVKAEALGVRRSASQTVAGIMPIVGK